jgi:hypothetical protein
MHVTRQIEHRIDVNETVDAVRTDGFRLIKGLFSQDVVAALNDEFDKAFCELPPGVSIGTHPPGRMATINARNSNHGSLPITHSIFLSPTIREISEILVSPNTKVNDKILMTNETKSMPITDVHFDAERALKIMIFLLDTDESNGVISFCRGSHIENSAYRSEFIKQGGQLLDLQNVASATDMESIRLQPVSGPAGSMVIFDTDCWHAGGCLEDDTKERRIIRSRSLFGGQPPLQPPRFTPLWFRRRFNVFVPPPPFSIPGRQSTRGTARR